VRREDLLTRLAELPATRPVLAALAGEPGVHVVGGAVRDVLLGRTPSELDIVVEGDAADVAARAAERLGGDVVVHPRFGTATVRAGDVVFDVASARRERYARPGALPDTELGAPIEEDLRRRDFTVNSIALAVADGAVRAVAGALEDVESGVLRVLHPGSFEDDPTRMLRLVRYAARLGFGVDPATEALIRPELLRTLTATRVGAELALLLREPQPEALLELERRGLAATALHPSVRLDAGVVERALALCDSPVAALAAACIDVPPAALHSRLDELAFGARERDVAVRAAADGRSLAEALDRTGTERSALAALLRGIPEEVVAVAGALGPQAAARWWLDDGRHVRLEITGEDLLAAGLRGPAIGRALQTALAARLDGRAPGREAQLRAALESSA
jgi:tRNA nucleotidyltransferase (CCA-adding enzyme)